MRIRIEKREKRKLGEVGRKEKEDEMRKVTEGGKGKTLGLQFWMDIHIMEGCFTGRNDL